MNNDRLPNLSLSPECPKNFPPELYLIRMFIHEAYLTKFYHRPDYERFKFIARNFSSFPMRFMLRERSKDLIEKISSFEASSLI